MLSIQHFGGHIIGSATKGLLLFLMGGHSLPGGPPEIGQFDLPIGQQNILRLDIPMHDPGPLEEIEHLSELADILLDHILGEFAVGGGEEAVVEVTSCGVLE